MKIYFAVSIRGGRELLDLYKKIANLIITKSHSITNSHVILGNVLSREGGISPIEIYKRDMKWMDESDIVIAETTTPSIGVGYEIGRAIEKKKKVYCFYNKDKEKTISMMIRGNNHIILKPYKTEKELLLEIEKILSKSQINSTNHQI